MKTSFLDRVLDERRVQILLGRSREGFGGGEDYGSLVAVPHAALDYVSTGFGQDPDFGWHFHLGVGSAYGLPTSSYGELGEGSYNYGRPFGCAGDGYGDSADEDVVA